MLGPRNAWYLEESGRRSDSFPLPRRLSEISATPSRPCAEGPCHSERTRSGGCRSLMAVPTEDAIRSRIHRSSSAFADDGSEGAPCSVRNRDGASSLPLSFASYSPSASSSAASQSEPPPGVPSKLSSPPRLAQWRLAPCRPLGRHPCPRRPLLAESARVLSSALRRR